MDVGYIKEILSKPLSEIEQQPKLAGVLLRYYRYLYPNTSICGGCWNKVYLELKSMDFAKLEAMEKSKYRMKDGVTCPMRFGDSRHISNLNISDELAEEFLRINENRIGLFVKFPADWKTRVFGSVSEVEVEKPKARVYKKRK